MLLFLCLYGKLTYFVLIYTHPHEKRGINMKKLLTILLVLVMALTFAACGSKAAVPIDDGVIWEVASVQEKASGNIIACSEAMAESYPDADIIEMICAAKDGKITLNCSTTDELAEGFYATSKSGESTVYALKFGLFDAAGVTSFTTYDDGTQVKTLIVETEEYVLNFIAP